WLKQSWQYVLSVELLFHAALIGWTVFKAYNPNIETAGGEKWMEIAFINGTLRSDYFPPQDPWLSGFAISYYYFGYVLLAMTTRFTGLISTTAFNLYIPTLFAMTLTAAFGIVANLVILHQRQSDEAAVHGATLGNPAAMWSGLLGALFVAVLGNLEGLLEVFHKRGLFPASFWEWLDIRDLKVPPAGPGDSWIPDRFIWWWRGSRVLTDYNLAGHEQEVIDEFPFFSFLLGDVHPHVLALPFVLLVVVLALNLFVNQTSPAQVSSPAPENIIDKTRNILENSGRELVTATGGWLGFLIYAICLGGLSFLNTWDFPIYLGMTGLSFMAWLTYRHENWSTVLQTALVGTVLLGIVGVVLYFPFYATFQSQAKGFLPNLWNPTRFVQFFVFFGPFLVATLALLVTLSRPAGLWKKYISSTVATAIIGPLLVMLLLLSAMVVTPNGREYIQGILNNPEVQQVIGQASVGALLQESLGRRLANPWTMLIVGGMVGWVAALFIGERQQWHQHHPDKPAGDPSGIAIENFALILLFAGLGLTLAVEFVYLRDNFGIRMNTVFKFYFQAWVLLALASAFALYYVSHQAKGEPVLVWQAAMVVLVAGAMVYPVLATADKANYFQNEPTLDGIRWVSQSRPGDHAAIEWLRANAPDDAVLLEAPGAGYAAYQYTGRVSALTGVPTLLGWGGHQSQWRGNYEEPARREPDIETLFNTPDLGQMQSLLDKYGITYVYVGPLERERYNPRGLAKFDQALRVAFQQDGVTIYER
ncbi:MAG: DUF2298 domain-containing protein, partial [Anaerolineae bacterium]|nr:DUF2298 domain-containing protein [Anaerolineae bacterium]